MRFFSFPLALWLTLPCALACNGDSDGSPDGGGDGLTRESDFRLSCAIDPVVLEIPLELSYAIDRPYSEGSSTELTFSATVVFNEASSSALIDAGVGEIDIVSMRVGAWGIGAEPAQIDATLTTAPINDFDLVPDTDDNGAPGPHSLELQPVTVTSVVSEGATEVELGLLLDQIALVLGDFEVPADCVSPILVGPSAVFPVR